MTFLHIIFLKLIIINMILLYKSFETINFNLWQIIMKYLPNTHKNI